MSQTIWYLWPQGQTWGYKWANHLQDMFWCNISPVGNQVELVNDVMSWESDLDACLVAYSHNFDRDAVRDVFKDTRLNTRTLVNGLQRLRPDQLEMIMRIQIQQCLIGTGATDLKNIEKIYAHEVAAKQMPQVFRELGIDGSIIELCESNGVAINRALDDDNPQHVAIWPDFWIQEWLTVLQKEEPEEWKKPRETSFALIRNPSFDDPIVPKNFIHDWKYWSLIFPKIKEEEWWDITIRTERIAWWVNIESDRTWLSPWSWDTVAGFDTISDHPDNIKAYVSALQTWTHSMRTRLADLIVNGRLAWNHQRGVEEVQYLGPCPVIYL